MDESFARVAAKMLFIVLLTWLWKWWMNHACSAATIMFWSFFFKLWMKDGSVLSYRLLDPLLDDESEECVEHGWKSYLLLDPLLLDEKSKESAEHGWKLYLLLNLMSLAEYGWKYIRLGRYTKYRSYIFLPPNLIYRLVLKWWHWKTMKGNLLHLLQNMGLQVFNTR